ncbi:unnamed protein product [Triticum turgidum subsp. durum]|uniref:Uncharacterized protein n=1 Tax=Triticum turgidum subsp. durum TaxID=4567 RepID=A0A9R1QQC6_TRITD|nr:unnamed protein product [Triticum turgidum subsp. durum]
MAPPSQCLDAMHGAAHNGTAPAVADTKPQCPTVLDADVFRRQGHQVIDFIAEYYGGMGDYPVHPSVTPGFLRNVLPAEAPSRPEPDAFGSALRDVRDLILPGMTHWQSPRHFAHFPACAVGSTLTEEHHVTDAWKVVQDRASVILRKMEIIYSVLG